jgi:protein TonB
VVLSVTVGTDGSARNVEVTHSSGHELLDRAALNTVRAWRFDPATHRGVPFVMTVEVPVRFELRDERW